jgi:hypothetical protein
LATGQCIPFVHFNLTGANYVAGPNLHSTGLSFQAQGYTVAKAKVIMYYTKK